MERDDHEGLATFIVGESELLPGAVIALGDASAHHVRVRRLGVGTRVGLLDGHGHRAVGTLVRGAPNPNVEVESVAVSAPLPTVHLLVPIADKDRMLWLAEKATELGVSSWRPVLYRRSKSVKPRGEGPMFTGRVQARMASALAQSHGVWLPSVFPESNLGRTLAALPAGGSRVLLDGHAATALTAVVCASPTTVAVGPEGGLDADEIAEFEAHGFGRARLGGHTLRFETAAIAGLAVVRTLLSTIHA